MPQFRHDSILKSRSPSPHPARLLSWPKGCTSFPGDHKTAPPQMGPGNEVLVYLGAMSWQRMENHCRKAVKYMQVPTPLTSRCPWNSDQPWILPVFISLSLSLFFFSKHRIKWQENKVNWRQNEIAFISHPAFIRLVFYSFEEAYFLPCEYRLCSVAIVNIRTMWKSEEVVRVRHSTEDGFLEQQCLKNAREKHLSASWTSGLAI